MTRGRKKPTVEIPNTDPRIDDTIVIVAVSDAGHILSTDDGSRTLQEALEITKGEVFKLDTDELITAADRIPSNWSINNLSYEIYEFANSATGKVFVGKVQDFNKKYLTT
jgi:hypothetical protein